MDRTIDSIIIHCSASPDAREFTVKDIELWHKQRALGSAIGAKPEPWNKFLDKNGIERFCGYHQVICRNGSIEEGRPDHIIGCHAAGHNKSSIGLCWIGLDAMTDPQRTSLIYVTAFYMNKYAIKVQNVKGHCELPNVKKTCPNIDMDEFREMVLLNI